jgi:hypothetical protein
MEVQRGALVSGLEGLEAFLRVLGLPYVKRGDMFLAEYEDRRLGRVGIVIGYDRDTGFVRVAVPTDVEPTEGGLWWLLRENFTVTTYKYGLDYDSFITVIVDVSGEAVASARDLRRLMAEAVEGYRRLMERVEEGKEETGTREASRGDEPGAA